MPIALLVVGLVLVLAGLVLAGLVLRSAARARARAAARQPIAPLPRRFDWEAFDRERRVHSGDRPL